MNGVGQSYRVTLFCFCGIWLIWSRPLIFPHTVGPIFPPVFFTIQSFLSSHTRGYELFHFFPSFFYFCFLLNLPFCPHLRNLHHSLISPPIFLFSTLFFYLPSSGLLQPPVAVCIYLLVFFLLVRKWSKPSTLSLLTKMVITSITEMVGMWGLYNEWVGIMMKNYSKLSFDVWFSVLTQS